MISMESVDRLLFYVYSLLLYLFGCLDVVSIQWMYRAKYKKYNCTLCKKVQIHGFVI